jgi:hypothetical protein
MAAFFLKKTSVAAINITLGVPGQQTSPNAATTSQAQRKK